MSIFSITVTNAIGSSDDVCSGGCPSWIIHWESAIGYAASRCSNVDCDETDDLVGAHVYRENEGGDNCYIIPLCRSCNNIEDEFEVYNSTDFVSDEEYDTCGRYEEEE